MRVARLEWMAQSSITNKIDHVAVNKYIMNAMVPKVV